MPDETLNIGKALDFSSIGDFERAARDFSEGNKELEQLLLDCFRNQMATNSCCAGHQEKDQKPYVSFRLNEVNKTTFNHLLLQLSELGYEFRYTKVENGLSHIQIQENENYDFTSPTLLFLLTFFLFLSLLVL